MEGRGEATDLGMLSVLSGGGGGRLLKPFLGLSQGLI